MAPDPHQSLREHLLDLLHGGGAHLHVLAALPNTLFLESGLLREGAQQRLVDGCYLLPEEPGLGGQL